MPTPNGPHNQPRWDVNDEADFAADLTEVSEFAAKVGNTRVGTTNQRNATAGADLWEGLRWYDTTTDLVYTYNGSGWLRQDVHKGGTFFDVVAADGTTQISHGLGTTPTDVSITQQSHPSDDQISRVFRPILFGSYTATRFNVRLIDERTGGWADGQQKVRFQWHAYAVAQ